ncbi:IS701 family transposase [Mesorhizobium loti]|uniref:IS701 family transposase n=1 Tax=Rhizobium loti TaxID=381 RepID=UPI0026812935
MPEVKSRIRRLFPQERVAISAGLFLKGLLRDAHRKTGWMRAEAAGDPGPWCQQAILGRGRRDADVSRDIVREYALETLADAEAVLVIDETVFVKQSKTSCGVARQVNVSTGKTANCQIGVFAAYASKHGNAFVDRVLYLPRALHGRPCPPCAVPRAWGRTFATKSRLAIDMIARIVSADVPFSWVAVDLVYSDVDIEMALRRWSKGYVLAVSADHHFAFRNRLFPEGGMAEDIARNLDLSGWRIFPPGEALKGSKSWAYRPFTDTDLAQFDKIRSGLWTAGLLIRRDANQALSYFSTWSPVGTEIETFVAVHQCCRIVEENLRTAKNELGLDHNETVLGAGGIATSRSCIRDGVDRSPQGEPRPLGSGWKAHGNEPPLRTLTEASQEAEAGIARRRGRCPWQDQSRERSRKPLPVKTQ